jgi:hypothetical protein
MSSDFTSTAKSSYGDSEEFQLAQRAFEGACWILGIDARAPARGEERFAVRRAKKLIANTVLAGETVSRDVQAMKTAVVLAVGDHPPL